MLLTSLRLSIFMNVTRNCLRVWLVSHGGAHYSMRRWPRTIIKDGRTFSESNIPSQ